MGFSIIQKDFTADTADTRLEVNTRSVDSISLDLDNLIIAIIIIIK